MTEYEKVKKEGGTSAHPGARDFFNGLETFKKSSYNRNLIHTPSEEREYSFGLNFLKYVPLAACTLALLSLLTFGIIYSVTSYRQKSAYAKLFSEELIDSIVKNDFDEDLFSYNFLHEDTDESEPVSYDELLIDELVNEELFLEDNQLFFQEEWEE